MHPTVETPPAPPASATTGVLHFSDILAFVLRHIRLIVFLPMGTAIVFAALFLLGGRPYSAQSSFALATSTANISRFAGLAAQFGMSFGTRPTESVDFYGVLLKSGDVLREVVLSEYTLVEGSPEAPDTVRGTLLDLIPTKGKTEERRIKAAIRRLRKNVAVSTDLFAGTVTVKVTDKNPALAEQINRRLLDIANAYNVERRKKMAADEREFFEARVRDALHELYEAEEALKSFMIENRAYNSSPALMAEAARLQRNVDLRQQVYTSLVQAYDQARVDEVRNTASISIVETPEGSARPATRLLFVLFAGGVFGGAIALTIAALKAFMDSQRANDPERYRELQTLWRTAVRRVIVPVGK